MSRFMFVVNQGINLNDNEPDTKVNAEKVAKAMVQESMDLRNYKIKNILCEAIEVVGD